MKEIYSNINAFLRWDISNLIIWELNLEKSSCQSLENLKTSSMYIFVIFDEFLLNLAIQRAPSSRLYLEGTEWLTWRFLKRSCEGIISYTYDKG